jgi:hypothetical protein
MILMLCAWGSIPFAYLAILKALAVVKVTKTKRAFMATDAVIFGFLETVMVILLITLCGLAAPFSP